MKTTPFNFKVNPITETSYLTLKLFYKVFTILHYSYITLLILQNVILKQDILYPGSVHHSVPWWEYWLSNSLAFDPE